MVSSDPQTPSETVPCHKVFMLANMTHLSMSNAQFLNIKNAIIFAFYDIDRTATYDPAALTTMTFTGLTVINNALNIMDVNSQFVSLFDMKSFLKPMAVSFKDSFFQGNLMIAGVISISESPRVDLNLMNNRFDNNFAQRTATALSARAIQGSLNSLVITNNIFTNNLCAGQGGVISLIETSHNVTLLNNMSMLTIQLLKGELVMS